MNMEYGDSAHEIWGQRPYFSGGVDTTYLYNTADQLPRGLKPTLHGYDGNGKRLRKE